MLDAMECRKRLASVVQQNFLAYRRGDLAKIDFNEDLYAVFSACPEAVWGEDLSFLAAWSFADYFFDAVLHGFAWGVPDRASGRELSIQESEEAIEHIIERLAQGADITHPAVLSYSRDLKPRPTPSRGLPGLVRSLAAAARRLLLRKG